MHPVHQNIDGIAQWQTFLHSGKRILSQLLTKSKNETSIKCTSFHQNIDGIAQWQTFPHSILEKEKIDLITNKKLSRLCVLAMPFSRMHTPQIHGH